MDTNYGQQQNNFDYLSGLICENLRNLRIKPWAFLYRPPLEAHPALAQPPGPNF